MNAMNGRLYSVVYSGLDQELVTEQNPSSPPNMSKLLELLLLCRM
jgi:hypothetical protein